MALSTIVKQLCKTCGKVAVEKSRFQFGQSKMIVLECGHSATEESLQSANYADLTSSDGKMKLMPFQITGVKFAEEANCRVLIADEQGLGKTVEALALLKLHNKELFPAVVATKATIKRQWMLQIKNWIPDAKVQVLFSGKEIAVPGFDVYITSYAMLAKEGVWKPVLFDIKTMILDECQQITNHLSDRSKGAQKIGKHCDHVIGLSGTPIRNHAGEYFTILNLIQPRLFPEYTKFLHDHCDTYENGWSTKVGGLKNPERFHELTKDFIIRRTQAEVLPELFALQLPRKFHHVELDRRFNKAYADALQELDDLMYSDESSSDIGMHKLAIMNKMRQITGVSKTTECADYLQEHIVSTGRRIAVFAHHHAAVNMLEGMMNKWLDENGYEPAVMVRAGDDSSEKLKILEGDKRKVLLCSGLASGEGMDGLQHLCSDMILLERFWNPASEEQIEKRLVRMGQTKPVNNIYMIASGTIDEYFTELVEQKRAIVSATLDNKEIAWDQDNLMSELANVLVTKGKKAWKL